jgi:hypothetical protein
MHSKAPGFAVLYPWRIHPGKEQVFVAAWTRISELLLSERGSLGSRLHRGADGLWYSDAPWPSSEARDRALAAGAVDAQALAQLRSAIVESLPEVALEPVSDLLVHAPGQDA